MYFQARLTNDQKTNVKLENDRRRNVKSEEILRRANVDNMYPHFPERKVQKIKQFRVLDAKNPTATVRFSIWDPSKEVEDLVQTKGFIRVCGAVATCNNYITEIEIRNSEVTTIEKWKGNVEDNLDKFKTYFRHLTPISEVNNQDFAPLQNEFDILCIVIDLHKHSG